MCWEKLFAPALCVPWRDVLSRACGSATGMSQRERNVKYP